MPHSNAQPFVPSEEGGPCLCWSPTRFSHPQPRLRLTPGWQAWQAAFVLLFPRSLRQLLA